MARRLVDGRELRTLDRMRRVAFAAAVVVSLACGSCISSCSGPTSLSPSPSASRPVEATACSSKQIRHTVRDFFRAWNTRNRAGLADLFTPDGELDFSTKAEDALSDGAKGYTISASRPRIAAFVARQWRLGEHISYRTVVVFAGSHVANTGADVTHVVAHFADGTSQPFSEAKFHYDCSSRLVPHSVFVSGSAAK